MRRLIGLLIKVFYPFIKIYWLVFKPHVSGIKCILKSGDKILWVRHTYGIQKWTFPGGSIKKGEKPRNAVLREMKEELGVTPKNLQCIGQFLYTGDGKQDTIYCFVGRLDTMRLRANKIEILETKWCSLHEFPSPFSLAGKRIYDLWRKK